jgi:hypothetical protein
MSCHLRFWSGAYSTKRVDAHPNKSSRGRALSLLHDNNLFELNGSAKAFAPVAEVINTIRQGVEM